MYEATPDSTTHARTTQRYAKCIEASKRISWDIERDVIRGREFDFTKKFLPDGLSKVNELTFLQPAENAVPVANPGPHLCQHLRAGGTVHPRQDA